MSAGFSTETTKLGKSGDNQQLAALCGLSYWIVNCVHLEGNQAQRLQRVQLEQQVAALQLQIQHLTPTNDDLRERALLLEAFYSARSAWTDKIGDRSVVGNQLFWHKQPVSDAVFYDRLVGLYRRFISMARESIASLDLQGHVPFSTMHFGVLGEIMSEGATQPGVLHQAYKLDYATLDNSGPPEGFWGKVVQVQPRPGLDFSLSWT
jgi:hypothetical protein